MLKNAHCKDRNTVIAFSDEARNRLRACMSALDNKSSFSNELTRAIGISSKSILSHVDRGAFALLASFAIHDDSILLVLRVLLDVVFLGAASAIAISGLVLALTEIYRSTTNYIQDRLKQIRKPKNNSTKSRESS